MRTVCRWWIVAVIVLGAGCARPYEKDSLFVMGTFVEVTSRDPRAFAIVFDEFKRLEKVASAFDPDSELARLNAKGEIDASQDLFDLLKSAREFHRISEGRFDVTIAPVSMLWKRAIREAKIPEPSALQASRELVGFDNVYLDETSRRVKLLKSGMAIDLGGIAKGYAVDRAAGLLRRSGIMSALINAGGNIYALGTRAGRPWRVGVRDPRNGDRALTYVNVKDQGIATSGDYEQFFEIGGIRYSHIIDPKTGAPVRSGLAGVTVVANDATSADALTTACFLSGKEGCARIAGAVASTTVYGVDDNNVLFRI